MPKNAFNGVLARSLAAIALVAALSGCASVPGRRVDAGPLYSTGKDVHGTATAQAVGPLVERQASDDGMTFKAVRPFWSRVTDPGNERAVSDFLWPLGMNKTYRGERDWRFFPAFGHDFDVDQPRSRHRWTVFPLLFGGRSLHGDPYFAIFPLGGTLCEFLGRDRIVFVLFPLYGYTKMDETRSHSVLWPVFSRTVGPDIYRWRAWPFYGYSYNQDRWTKRFVMWPFWTSVEYHFPDQQGGGYILFPIYGRLDVGDRHSRMLLPPFFKYEWAGDRHRAWNAPWPFLQYSRGSVDKFYLWPFYGRKALAHERQWFALWPLVSARRSELPKKTVNHFRALPLVYYESAFDRQPAGAVDDTGSVRKKEALSRYFKLWPLFSYRREADHSLLRALALWPLKHTPGIERNWAPLWSLYTRERAGDARESELLWGLYRQRRTASQHDVSVFPLLQTRRDDLRESASWSILYGLFGIERQGPRRTWRFLYFLKVGSRIGAAADSVETAHPGNAGGRRMEEP
jgi:hypothetical protein